MQLLPRNSIYNNNVLYFIINVCGETEKTLPGRGKMRCKNSECDGPFYPILFRLTPAPLHLSGEGRCKDDKNKFVKNVDKIFIVTYISIKSGTGEIMPIKIIAGQVAGGDDFFNRKNEVEILWQRIKSGSNVIISAPRRVGKTSLVCHIRDNPRTGYHVLYMITESVNDENEFFKKMYKHVVAELKAARRFASFLKNCTKETLGRIEKISLSEATVQLSGSGINYYDEFVALIKSLDCSDEKVVLVVDEFAQTVMNIRNDQDDSRAIRFLENNRTLRQMPEIRSKIQFVYAGSIGLENIVGRMNASQTINDLNNLVIGPFTPKDAGELILALAQRPGLVIGPEQVDYLLKKVEWLIPYYVQLIAQELDVMMIDATGEKLVTDTMIDAAFERIIEYRNYFENWHTRLRASYKKEEYNFAKEVLNTISEAGTMQSAAMFGCAVRQGIEESYKEVVNALKHDGYINNTPDARTYRFNSPILKAWWFSNVAN